MERYSRILRACVPIAAGLVLAACASDGPAPVEDLGLSGRRVAPATTAAPQAPRVSGDRHRVQRGDTLYSIAFRHGVDYRELASWNGIGPPYTIRIGQELRTTSTMPALAKARASERPPARRPSTPAAPPVPFETVTASAASTPADAASPAATASAPPPRTTPSIAPVPAPPAGAAIATPAPGATSVVGDVTWRWPADGKVVGTFAAGNPTRQGIDIAGRSGDPVRAAADGSVVYSGNGLIGYGELIIVKHSASFLSAYGHNRKRLVKEGDRVRAGQTIAEMGSSSANRDSLHFEIRRNGKPANPADYLPRR